MWLAARGDAADVAAALGGAGGDKLRRGSGPALKTRKVTATNDWGGAEIEEGYVGGQKWHGRRL